MPKAGLAVGIGVAAAAAVAVVLLVRSGDSDGGDGGSAPSRPAPRGPVVVSFDGLQSFVESVGHPVYWAGQRPGRYELTVDASGNIFIRYLEGKVQAGSRRQTSLTVGTYPYSNAYRTLQSASRQPGAAFARTPDGGLIVAGQGSPDNVHIAYPQRDVQVEVYDPRAGRSLELARAGRIVPLP